MSSYYYLVAQLPYLIYGQNLPMSPEAFKTMARQAMSSADAAVLDCCTLDPIPPKAGDDGATYAKPASHTISPLVNKWKDWERALRLHLANGRAQRFNRESGDTLEPPVVPEEVAAIAKTALYMESPLEAELFLDKARWDAIESFQDLNIFSENSVYAYLLKLLLMERRALFNAEEGLTEYKGLYAAILKNAGSVTVAGFTPGLVSDGQVSAGQASAMTEPGEPK